MDFFKQNQTAILVIVIVVIAFFAYSYFFTGKESSNAVLQEEQVSTATPADQDLISLLLELKSITLDEAIFSNQAFQSLEDFSQDLVNEPVGRVNPFAPLGQGQSRPASGQ
ncbi:hypothetical protein K2P56_03215 [Patescibacteria group bacterium]|nr:hypothetical protein [Patescibacteria group bacterium]